MKRRLFTLAATAAALVALPCMAQLAAPNIPPEIFVPPGGTLVKVKQEMDGDFGVKYHLPDGNVQALAQQARARAEQHGYRVFKSEDKGHEVEVDLVRGNSVLEISVEKEWNGVEYDVEIDQHGAPMQQPAPVQQQPAPRQ